MPRFRLAMLSGFLVTLLALRAGSAQHQPDPDKSPGNSPEPVKCRLVWRNGDSLPGQLLGVKDGVLNWRSPLFTRPALIDVEALSSVELLSETGTTPTEPFRVMLRNGDFFRAELVAIDTQSLTVKSQRHGTIRIDRERMRELRRLDDPSVLFIGPSSLNDWATLSQGEPFERWRSTPDGHVGTTGWLAELFRKMDLPEQVEIEIQLQSTGRPRFLIAFNDNPDESVRLETWDEEIYALGRVRHPDTGKEEEALKSVLTLEPEMHAIKLRLYWNRKTGHLAVYSHAGKPLQEMTGIIPTDGQSGLYIRNKGTQLTIEHLRVARWNGGPPREIRDGDGTRVQLLNGEILYGAAVSSDPVKQTMTLKTESGSLEIAVSAIERLHFADDAADVSSLDPVRLQFSDGSVLTGQLAGMSAGNLLLSCRGIEPGVPAPLQLISRATIGAQPSQSPGDGTVAREPGTVSGQKPAIDGRPVEPPKIGAGDSPNARLITETGSLAGTLAVGDVPGEVIQWRPIGAVLPVPLAADSVARIVRNDVDSKAAGVDIAENRGIDTAEFPDLLFLTTQDVIPCRIKGTDAESVYLASPVSDVSELEHKWIKAVEFGGSNSTRRASFKDSEWEIANLAGQIDHQPDSVGFTHSGRLHHPRLFPADEISFTVKWSPEANVNIAVYYRHETGTPLRTRPTLQFVCFRQQLATVNDAGTMVRQPRNARLDLDQPTVRIRIVRYQGLFRVEVDGEEAYSARLNDDELVGRALTINVANTTQNARLIGFGAANVPAPANLKSDLAVSIEDFRIGFCGLGFAKHVIDEELREQALTVPRFRRGSGASHIIVARNGDLLRGTLRGVDADRVRFVSLSEELGLSRDVIGAIVWLHPDQDEPAPEWNESVPVVHAAMRNEMSLVLQPDGSQDGQLAGGSPILGRCSVPLGEIRELLLGRSAESRVKAAYADWKSKAAREPDFPGVDGDGDSESSFTSHLTGHPAPEFETPTLEGPVLKLSDLRGKIVVIDFWATWCGPCVRWMPELDRIVEQAGFDNVELLAVNQQETPILIRDFLLTQAMKGRVLLDGNAAVARKFGVETLPQTLVIDRDGTVVWHAVGYSRNTGSALRKMLDSLLTDAVQKPE